MSSFKGSRPLPNNKHELFCRHVVSGKKNTDAYYAAGYIAKNRNTASSAATRMRKTQPIIDRIEWLQYENNKDADASKARLIEELKYIAFGRVTDYVRFDENGVIPFTSDEIPYSKAGALKNIRTDTKTIHIDGQPVKTVEIDFNMHDKLGAIKQLSELLGMNDDMEKLRTMLRSYGYDIEIDRNTGEFNFINLENIN